MERLTYRDDNGRALLTHFGKQMYCSTQATADCVCILEERLEETISLLKAQEPLAVKVFDDFGSIKFGYCPTCRSTINNQGYPKSCGCGQAVKWE